MKSDRFYWCTGCGKWHDPLKENNPHYLMYWPIQAPTMRNFEGTVEELERFIIAQRLKQQDAYDFERRIDNYGR